MVCGERSNADGVQSRAACADALTDQRALPPACERRQVSLAQLQPQRGRPLGPASLPGAPEAEAESDAADAAALEGDRGHDASQAEHMQAIGPAMEAQGIGLAP